MYSIADCLGYRQVREGLENIQNHEFTNKVWAYLITIKFIKQIILKNDCLTDISIELFSKTLFYIDVGGEPVVMFFLTRLF